MDRDIFVILLRSWFSVSCSATLLAVWLCDEKNRRPKKGKNKQQNIPATSEVARYTVGRQAFI